MKNVFKIHRFELAAGASCLIDVDSYVPLRFRLEDRVFGAHYLRLGDASRSLAELLIEPNTGVLRGITITWFAELAEWPTIAARQGGSGLPAFEVSWDNTNRIDAGCPFCVSVRAREILLHWRSLEDCDALDFQDRVQFLVVEGQLAGVRFSGFSAGEMDTFVAHAAAEDSSTSS